MIGSSELGDLYREVILDHNKRPRNFGEIPDAERTAHGDNPLCGDTVTVYLSLDGDRLEAVSFRGSGCAISQAAASMMTDAVAGLSVPEARELSERFRRLLTGGGGAADAFRSDESTALGKLAVFAGVKDYPMRVKCATLPWHTLAAALEDRDEPVTTE